MHAVDTDEYLGLCGEAMQAGYVFADNVKFYIYKSSFCMDMASAVTILPVYVNIVNKLWDNLYLIALFLTGFGRYYDAGIEQIGCLTLS